MKSEEQKISVLLVDDQMIVAEGIRRMLEDEQDIEFHYCDNPAEAMQKAEEIQAMVILQDLVMPDVDGMTLLRFFRNNPATDETPIIVLSSKDDPVVKQEAFSNGANDYLVKLPEKIELIARIHAHSRSFLAQKERDSAFEEMQKLQTALEKSNEELQRLSILDGLTGVANRRNLDENLTKEWKRAARESTEIAFIMIDIDHFKPYNDNYGHQEGDVCLKRVSATLNSVPGRPADLFARYGGEEFAAVLPHTNLEGAKVVAEKMRTAVDKLNLKHEYSQIGHVTISLGVASLKPEPNTLPDIIITSADGALYKAKESGRNQVKCGK